MTDSFFEEFDLDPDEGYRNDDFYPQLRPLKKRRDYLTDHLMSELRHERLRDKGFVSCPACQGEGYTPEKGVCEVCKGRKILVDPEIKPIPLEPAWEARLFPQVFSKLWKNYVNRFAK